MCEGGLAVPHVATGLLSMAATAVGSSLERSSADLSFTVADTMWQSKWAVVRGVHSDPIDSMDAGYVAATASLLRRHLYAAT